MHIYLIFKLDHEIDPWSVVEGANLWSCKCRQTQQYKS